VAVTRTLKSRLKLLEAKTPDQRPEPPWSPPEVYAGLRREAQAEIERDLKIEKEPLFWIDDAGIIRATDDGSFVRHMGDYVRAGDRSISRLTAEIAEAEVGMTPAELTRSRAELEEFDKSLDGLSLDEKIRVLKAEISILEAEEPGGVSANEPLPRY
jgi:hypothetical protein